MSEEKPEKLYSIKELILWLEDPRHQWGFNRPMMFAKYARKELRRTRLTLVVACALSLIAGIVIGLLFLIGRSAG